MSKSMICGRPCQFRQGLPYGRSILWLCFWVDARDWQRPRLGLGPSPLWRSIFLATNSPPLAWYSMTMSYSLSIFVSHEVMLFEVVKTSFWASGQITTVSNSQTWLFRAFCGDFLPYFSPPFGGDYSWPWFSSKKPKGPYKSPSHPTRDSRASSPVGSREIHCFMATLGFILHETLPQNKRPKRKLVYQPSIFRCENVSFREGKDGHIHHDSREYQWKSRKRWSLWGHGSIKTYQAPKPCRSHSSHASA